MATFANQLNWACLSLMVTFMCFNCILIPNFTSYQLISKLTLTMISPFEQFNLFFYLGVNYNKFDLSLTNATLFWLLSLFMVTNLAYKLNTHLKIKLNSYSMAVMLLTKFVQQLIVENLNTGTKANYFNFLLSMFISMLMMNNISLIPYSFSLSAHAAFCFFMSCGIWLGLLLKGILNFKQNFMSSFLPHNSPIMLVPLLVPMELISYGVSAVSLGLSLSANLTSGHILLAMMAKFVWNLFNTLKTNYLIGISFVLPLGIILFLNTLEMGMACIQAFVFTLLVTIYLKDSIELH